ncbi:MAG: hypothetical protein FJW23_02725 [Acidimicrobiia bacterium]|nr:hypothetical protein [Acidimicrobiia bacterium]
MIPDLERLIELQRLETTIADATQWIAAHPERLQAADARLDSATLVVNAARDALKGAQERRRDLEKEAAVFQGRLTKFKDQLSAVKTNREYQAMLKEIETAETELRAAEDKVLEEMLAADGAAAEAKAAERALAEARTQVNADKRDMAAELAAAEKRLQEASQARAAIVAQLDARLVQIFEQVAKVRKGIGVCVAADGLCSLCHVRLRPHVYQQVRHNDTIIQCESCHRILYFVPPPPQAEPQPAHAT